MKAGELVTLCGALVAAGICARADDTVDQAAARAALEQKLHELDQPDARPAQDANSATAATNPPEPTAISAAPVSTAPAQTGFTATLPAANASARAAALAAMEQKMNELNQPQAGSTPDTGAAPVVVPVNEASAMATPLTEAPPAEAPRAIAPAITSAAVAPVSTAPATAAVAVVPTANPGTDAMPSQTPTVVALPSSAAGPVRPTTQLVTTTGATYKNVEVQKVTADAIVISYTPMQGGWAMTRINFSDLPPDIRQQYEKP